MAVSLYRVIKNSVCTWRLQYSTQLMSWRWPSENTFGTWTVLYWTRPSRTQFGVSINVWRLAGDHLNITCNFLYCNHQVHRDFLITLYLLLKVRGILDGLWLFVAQVSSIFDCVSWKSHYYRHWTMQRARFWMTIVWLQRWKLWNRRQQTLARRWRRRTKWSLKSKLSRSSTCLCHRYVAISPQAIWLCGFWSFCSGVVEDAVILGCDTVWQGSQVLMF